MTGKITSAKASGIFEQLKTGSQGKDYSELSALLVSLKGNGLIISVDSNSEKPIWDDSPGAQFMEVVQSNRLLIAGWPVYEWTTSFWGYWGGMGAGWFTERGDSTLEAWLEELLDAGDLLPDDADVPRPENLDKDK